MNYDWIIQSISAQIYRQYPELTGVHPEVHWAQDTKSTRCTLIYKASVKTINGKNLLRRVKVTSDTDGKIIKLSSSK